MTLQVALALAVWLRQRPQFGRDGLLPGRPEVFGVSLAATLVLDAVEFLWASRGLFDDDTADPATTGIHRPARMDLHTVVGHRGKNA